MKNQRHAKSRPETSRLDPAKQTASITAIAPPVETIEDRPSPRPAKEDQERAENEGMPIKRPLG